MLRNSTQFRQPTRDNGQLGTEPRQTDMDAEIVRLPCTYNQLGQDFRSLARQAVGIVKLGQLSQLHTTKLPPLTAHRSLYRPIALPCSYPGAYRVRAKNEL